MPGPRKNRLARIAESEKRLALMRKQRAGYDRLIQKEERTLTALRAGRENPDTVEIRETRSQRVLAYLADVLGVSRKHNLVLDTIPGCELAVIESSNASLDYIASATDLTPIIDDATERRSMLERELQSLRASVTGLETALAKKADELQRLTKAHSRRKTAESMAGILDLKKKIAVLEKSKAGMLRAVEKKQNNLENISNNRPESTEGSEKVR